MSEKALKMLLKISDNVSAAGLVTCMYLYLMVCHSYVLVCHPCHPSLVCAHVPSVCHSCMLVCHSRVTRIHSYVIRMSLVCGFAMSPSKSPQRSSPLKLKKRIFSENNLQSFTSYLRLALVFRAESRTTRNV